MPLKTIRQLDEVIKTTTVVYDHSNAKLVSKKNKVRRCGKDAFLSSHPYSTFSCHRSAENKLLASSTTQPKFKHTNRRATKSTKQKLQFCVQAHLPLVPKTLSFELDPETPISTLKGLISKKFGVKPRHQRLYIRRNIWLCDLLTLHDNGIDKDDIISLSTHDAAQNGSKENTTVDEEYVCLLSSKIGSSWRKLAKHLGYEDAEIAEIQANIRVTSEASRQMLFTWRKKIRDRDEAFQKLRQALTTVGLTDLAQNIPDSCQSRDKVAGSQSEQHKDTKAAEQNKPKGATTSEAQTQLKGKDLKTDGPQALQYVKQKLQIFIGNPLLRGPRTFCFQLDPKASISSLKKIIHRKIGVLPQHQCLYIIRNCRNFQLCDLLTLSDCGIQQDENVLFRLSTDGLRGGGPKGDDQLLRDLSSKVQEFWIELAKILGIESEIKTIQDLIESDKERSHQMLLSWWNRQGNREAGLEKLRESLISIGLFEQALLIPGNGQDAINKTKMQPKQAGEDDLLTAVGSDDLKDDGHITQASGVVSGSDIETQSSGGAGGNVSGSDFATQSSGDAGAGTGLSAGLITGASGVVSRSVIGGDGDAGDTGVATAQLVGQITQAPGDALRGEVGTKPSYTSTKLSTSAIPAFKLSQKILYELAKQLGPQWEELAIQLGFPSGVIDGFKSDNQMKVVMQGFKMLVAWMQKQDDDAEQQVQRLCAALRNVGRVDVTKTLPMFPGMQIETDLLKNGMKSPTMTLLFRKLVKELLSTCGESYVMNEFFAALKLWDMELEDVTYKSVVFVIRVKTRVGLEKLWAMYTTGELAKKLTEIFVTDDLTTEDKSDLSIQVTIPEKDYEQCCRFFEELDNATHEGNEQDASSKMAMLRKQFREDDSIATAASNDPAEQAAGQSEEETNASHITTDSGHDISSKTDLSRQKKFGLTSSEMTTSGGDPAEQVVDRCAEVVKTLYMTTGSYAQIIKWVDDKTKKMIMPKHMFEISGESILNYEDIFHMKTLEGGSIETVVLTRKDDEERSFLLENIAYDWAAGSSSILQKFKLVVLLQMGALQEESDFVDTIYDQLLWQHRDINKDDLLSFIDAKSHEMLLLLDNFDKLPFHELVETKFGSVRQILRRMVASGSTVLITTYPNKIQALVDKSLLQEPYIHVALPGVFGDRIEEFVSQICSEETGQAETLLKRIKSSKHLSDLAKDMKLLLLLCLVSKHSTLPETLTRVFDEVVRYIFTRRLNMSQEEISGVVNAIGKTALGDHHETPLGETRLGKTRLGKTPLGDLGFVYDWQWYVSQRREFTEKEFERGALDKALQAGFLSRQPIPRGEVSEQYGIRFIHKRMQDFCGAKYCQSLFDNDTKKFQEILDRHSKNREFLLFLCGDNEQCARHVLGFLHTEKAQRRPLMRAGGKLTVDTGSQSRTDFELALNCYFESQSTDLFSVDFIDSLITEEMTIDYKNNDSLHSVMWILEHISKHDRGRDFLARVRSLTVSECNPARSSKAFGSSLAEMKGLCSLQLNTCILTDCDVSQILSSVGKAGNLTELVVSNSLGLDDNAETWASSLNTIIHLKSLTLSSCNINAQDFTHVARWLVEPLDLTYLNLSNNGELGGTANVWALHLKFLKSLKKLDLSSCEIEKQDMKYITASVGVLQHLYDLDLSGNKALGGCAGAWATSLKNMVHLETLRMANCNTDRRDVTHLVKTISLMANLMEFDFGSGEAELRVCSSDEGTRLTIGKFSFFVTDVVEILQSLSNREDLVAVTLHDIYGVSGSSAFWASNLKKLTHLGELNLSACILLSTDIGHLAAAVSQMPALKELKLEGNLHLGGSGREWAPSLTEMVHILSLRLGSCDLQSADIPHIAAALSRLPNLQNVDLRGNKLLRGSAETWAPSLKEMEHVRLIELGGCSLTDEDLEHVSKVKRSGVNLETD